MTKNIEIICSCGTTLHCKRETLQKNIGVIRCHVCGTKYESQAILNSERFGIADYTEVTA
jgi:uncharacterized Zn finger protein